MKTANEIAIEMLTLLNGDNVYNYPYTKIQFDTLTYLIQTALNNGVEFSQEFLDGFICGDVDGDLLPNDLFFIYNIITDIFYGVDERDEALPERHQPFHFDPKPYPVD